MAEIALFALEQVSGGKQTRGQKQFIRHKVKKEETLQSIALFYQVDAQTILDKNQKEAADIQPGMVLLIPLA